jgi:non-canonical purine NTP pyrophosphatase (RdgB/HAM1 family)
MKKITYITGNQKKADYLALYLGHPIVHRKVDLDEIQSMDLKKIVAHKVRQAYNIVKEPVIVEDTSLEFKSLGGLPGPFIKYFLENMPLEAISSLINGKDRSATARCVFGYFDGGTEVLFEGSLPGLIADKPAGEGGFGFDPIFIPEGFNLPRAILSDKEYETTYLRVKPIKQLGDFLKTLK